MFRCQWSGKLSNPREPQIRVVVETRKVRYENEVPVPDDIKGGTMLKVTTGTEIVRELAMTAEGYADYLKQQVGVQ